MLVAEVPAGARGSLGLAFAADPRQWDDVDELELATLSWVHWFNEHRLHGHCDDVPRPSSKQRSSLPHRRRRRHGKSDTADAIAAARAVQAGEAVGTSKVMTGMVEAIRLRRVARRSAMKARTQAVNQIHAVIVVEEVDDGVRWRPWVPVDTFIVVDAPTAGLTPLAERRRSLRHQNGLQRWQSPRAVPGVDGCREKLFNGRYGTASAEDLPRLP